jgi:hypothetical protein
MLIPLGFLAGSGGVEGDFELIETQILSSSQASITFTGLGSYSAVYKHLQIRAATRTSRTGFSNGLISLRFNGDTTSSYATHQLTGNGSSVASYASSSQTSILYALTGASADTATNGFGGAVLDILDPFSTTKNKTTRSISGVATGAIEIDSGLYYKTDSITSITLLGISSTNLLSGSRFSLYGIKG